MAEKFLYENILEEFGRRTIESIEIPDYLKDNLNPKFELRLYQIEAFARFFHCLDNVFRARTGRCIFCLTWRPAVTSGTSIRL